MIAYFDTSAIVPLLIAEPGTDAAGMIWDRAERVVSIRLARVEARAALAQAARIGRISTQQLGTSKRGLDEILVQLDLVEVDAQCRNGDGSVHRGYRLMLISRRRRWSGR